jgi:L-fuconate dehydratase
MSASLDRRIVEYVDHLHEHFVDPVTIRNGHYMPPTAPGYSTAIKPESRRRFAYPGGPVWSEEAA